MRVLAALLLLPGLALAAPDGRDLLLHGNALVLHGNALVLHGNALVLHGNALVLHGNAVGALPCAACHGVNGAGNPAMGAPALAGLPAQSIITALAQLAASQDGGMMPGIARALTPDERAAAAAYFAHLPRP